MFREFLLQKWQRLKLQNGYQSRGVLKQVQHDLHFLSSAHLQIHAFAHLHIHTTFVSLPH